MKKQFVLEVIILLLVTMFLYASVSKYIDINESERAMQKQPFPEWLNSLLVVVIPPVEILISISLIMTKTRKNGLLAASILMLLFTLYVGAALVHLFPRVPCSCGGVIKRLGWQEHFIFNVVFLTLSLTGLMLEYKINKQTSGSAPTY